MLPKHSAAGPAKSLNENEPHIAVDMAELLRIKLVAQSESSCRKRKIRKTALLAVEKLQPTPTTSAYLNLPRRYCQEL
jgi:hypothetical protein